MSQRNERDLSKKVHSIYLKASKGAKQKILDKLTATTGYHHYYAIRVQKYGYKRLPNWPKRRKAIYHREEGQALEQI